MSYIHKIQYYETDKMGVTHHSNYLRFMEEARIDYMDKIGIGYDKIEELGIISPVVSAECEYKLSTTYPDILTIDLEVLEYTGIKLIFGYTMKNENGKIVFLGKSKHCFIKDSKLINMKKEFPKLDEIFKEICVKK